MFITLFDYFKSYFINNFNFYNEHFISNINYSVKESQLEELFASYGAIQSAKIIMDRETGRSRGFGFVEMPNNDEANTAIESLNGALFQGKT